MRLLIDANLPRSLADRLRSAGHDVCDIRDTELRDARDELIAAFAQQQGRAIVTRDFDFADIRNYPPPRYAGIVVLDVPNETPAQLIIEIIERFFSSAQLSTQLPGHLAILEASRVRFR